MQLLPGRETFFGGGPAWLFYVFALISAAVCAAGIWARLVVWSRGQKTKERISWRALIVDGLLLKRLFSRDPLAAILHAAVLWGFLALLAGTALWSAHGRLTPFLRGRAYLIFGFSLDVAGVAFVAGVVGLALRRMVLGRKRLPTAFEDWWLLGLLFLVGVTGFLVEAARLAATRPDWAWAEPAGAWLAGYWAWGGPSDRALMVLWWVHALSALVLVALLPWFKLWHAVAAPANLAVTSGPLEAITAEAREEAAREFILRDLVAFDACARCNRCEIICPSFMAGEGLSPRKITQNMRQYAWQKFRPLKCLPPIKPRSAQASDFGLAAFAQPSFLCTTCGACEEACPVAVSPLRLIENVRANAIEQGTNVPAAIGQALTGLTKYANPWAAPRKKRGDWAQGLALADLVKGDEADWLLFAGCTTAFDARAQSMAIAMAEILQACGVNAGHLGKDEPCCGDLARRLGEAGLYEMLMEDSLSLLAELKVRRVVTMSPHCAYTMINDYPRLAGPLELDLPSGLRTLHYSELLDELLRHSRLKPVRRLNARATFHDPCYLGRHRGVYEAPRRVIASLGLDLVEMADHHEHSLCCGAGGGRMWHAEAPGAQTRIAELRVAQARDTGADLLITACPYCLIMLTDAVKTSGLEDEISVMDLAELTTQSLA